MTRIIVKKFQQLTEVSVNLPASKSVSNRVLILDALSGRRSQLENISEARDTKLMQSLLSDPGLIADAQDAGTTMRFLTSYFAITNQRKLLTGTERMQERPIGSLVEALKTLGADITYEKKEGYPPLKINRFSRQITNEVMVPGHISSQFISSLLLCAPSLPQGLNIHIDGVLGSKPYVDLTLSLMALFGISHTWEGSSIVVPPQVLEPVQYKIEPDWSAASYWLALAALAPQSNIRLNDLNPDQLQGDKAIIEIMKYAGVSVSFDQKGATLSKGENTKSLNWDFTHCPDLAQTVAVVFAAKNIPCTMTGLESLKIKETDRIKALDQELKKFGGGLKETKNGVWEVLPCTNFPEKVYISTYDDHRMAMAFAPLAAFSTLEIEDQTVVRKSYPRYWDDLKSAGIEIKPA